MKLFQQLLVAGTAISLITPFAAQASDTINLDGINSYGRRESKSKRIDSNSFINDVNEKMATLNGRIDGLKRDKITLKLEVSQIRQPLMVRQSFNGGC